MGPRNWDLPTWLERILPNLSIEAGDEPADEPGDEPGDQPGDQPAIEPRPVEPVGVG
jgi:RND superfamily putative drug exporter